MLSRCQTLFTNFSIDLKKQIGIWYEIKCRKLLSQVMRRSSYIFKENHVFIEEEDNPSNSPKVVIVEEELDGIDIDGIGNAVDLQTLLHFSFFFFFFLSGFSFTDTNDSQDSRGRERTIFYSTLPLPPAHEHSDIYLQLCMWDDYHTFLIATLVFTRLLLDEISPPYRITILLIDDVKFLARSGLKSNRNQVIDL